VDRSWQSWYVGSEDYYEPLIVADDYVCPPTAGRTSMVSADWCHLVLTFEDEQTRFELDSLVGRKPVKVSDMLLSNRSLG